MQRHVWNREWNWSYEPGRHSNYKPTKSGVCGFVECDAITTQPNGTTTVTVNGAVWIQRTRTCPANVHMVLHDGLCVSPMRWDATYHWPSPLWQAKLTFIHFSETRVSDKVFWVFVILYTVSGYPKYLFRNNYFGYSRKKLFWISGKMNKC